MSEITMTIPRDRTRPVSVEVSGVVGASCEDRTRALEAALGGRVDRTEKPEYYETTEIQEQEVGR